MGPVSQAPSYSPADLPLKIRSLGQVAGSRRVEVGRAYVRNGGWGCADKSCLTCQGQCEAEKIAHSAIARYDPAGLTPVSIHVFKYVGLALQRVASDCGRRRANESSVPRKVLRKRHPRAECVVGGAVARGNLLGLG